MSVSTDIVFGPEKEDTSPAPQSTPWKILVIDDDESIQQVTSLVLRDIEFEGRKLQLFQATTTPEAMQLIHAHPEVAVILMDVVMETETSGLDLVHYIRNECNNINTRIILRTGQPGQAPEDDVMYRYDINDYREKSELTAQKLKTSVISSLRNFSDLLKIQHLSINNTQLEKLVTERTRRLQNEVEEKSIINNRLAHKTLQLQQAQQIARLCHWEMDTETLSMHWSQQMCAMFHIKGDSQDFSLFDFLHLVPGREREMVEESIQHAIKSGDKYEIVHTVYDPAEQTHTVLHIGVPLKNEQEQTIKLIGTIQDITTKIQLEGKLHKLAQAIEQTGDAVMITDADGLITFVNPAFEEMTGFSRREAEGKKPNILKSGKQRESFYKRMWDIISRGEVFSDTVMNKKKDGSIYFEEKTISPLKDAHGRVTHFVSTARDITDRIRIQEDLYRLAHQDPLTGLPNRALLQDRVYQALTRTERHHRKLAMMLIDLDRFKIINDTLGHDIGDQLLKKVSTCLTANVREGDTVARLGGDEFAVLLNDLADEDDVAPIANKIVSEIAKPVEIANHNLFVTSSIGISLYPANGDTPQDLLKKADVAMYRAKAAGKNTFRFYREEDDRKALHKLSLETSLRMALDNDEYALHFQPQIDLVNGNIVGMEGLIRWSNKNHENTGPSLFVPILEETGLIMSVGEWAIHQACQQLLAWQAAKLPPSRIAVNLSSRQFCLNDLSHLVREILEEYRIDPSLLEFEITEGLLIDDIPETRRILENLSDMGIRLSIDDFGTGYSSMSYLKKLPFDSLKIDRSFINDLKYNKDDTAITRAIITMAHSLGMSVIAEGVETQHQLQYLRSQHCNEVQGYLVSPPVAPEEASRLLRTSNFNHLLTQTEPDK